MIVILSGIILIGFGAGAFNLLYSRIATADFSSLIDGVKVIGNKIYDLTGYHVIQQDFLNQFKGVLMSIVTNVLNATYNIGVNVFMMFVVLYFMLANVRKMERKIVSYSPFGSDSLNKIKSEVKNIIFSNAIGIPLIMFAQSVVASLGYWMLDIPDAIFWGFLTGLFGIVPLLGTTIIWLPMSVYLFATTSVWQALILLVYGALIVGNTDNVVRFVLLKKAANVHPLTTIFGVIMGIPLFGFWGIIFGPLLISCFLLLVKIYYSEYAVNK